MLGQYVAFTVVSRPSGTEIIGGNVRQSQPRRCPTLHEESRPFTGQAFPDDLHYLGRSQIKHDFGLRIGFLLR